MVLEAAKQLIDESRRVIGYEFKDAVFSSPLTLSLKSEGVDVEVFLRPLRDSSEKNSVKFEFKICAYINDRWHENCHGIIKAEYEAPKSEVDGGKEAAAKSSHYSQLYDRARRSCDGKVDASSMYDYMQNAGLAYGPAFRVLEHLSYNESGEAIGILRAFDGHASDCDHSYVQPHTIHPTTLDGLLQLMLVALSRGREKDAPTMVPKRIGKLWISEQGIHYPQTAAVDAYAQAAFTSRRTASALLLAFHRTTGDLLLSVDYSEATIVAAGENLLSTVSDVKKMCYNISWEPDSELLDSQQLRIHCEMSRPHRPSSVKFCKVLDLVLRTFASQALETLYESERPTGEAHLHQHVEWLRDQIARSNHQEQAIVQNLSQWDMICNYLGFSNLGKFYLKVGRSLPKVLRGELDPRALLTQDDTLALFYQHVNRETICYEPWQEYMRLFHHKKSGIKILEIGAEGGIMTDFVRQILDNGGQGHGNAYGCAQYDYTEVSPVLLEAAARKFIDYKDRIRFKLLEIESDLSAQGFEPQTYDLILAANSLRLTRDLNLAMRNVRNLLKPTGKLVLVEVTENGMRTEFALGLLPELRFGSYLSTQDWDNLLCRNGFSGVELETPDSLELGCHQYSILITSRNEHFAEMTPVSALTESPGSRILIIVSDEADAFQYMIADRLQIRLTAFGLCGDCSIVTLKQISKIEDITSRFCIALVEMDAPILSQMDEIQFENVRYLLTNVPRVLWVTTGGGRGQQDPRYHLVDGLARVARTEFNQNTYITLALEPSCSSIEATVDKIVRVSETNLIQQSSDESESEYVEIDGVLQIGRVTEANYLDKALQEKTTSNQVKMQNFGFASAWALQIGSPGLLDTLYFSEDSIVSQPLAFGELEIKVESAGVNFRDCLTALGQLDAISLGSECAGTVTRVGPGCDLQPGTRVSACFANTFKTLARGPEACTVQLPENISFTEASAIPVIFVTAWHALHDLGRLQPGESVLIHAAAGGTGQAAIQIAKLAGAVIYATVGSDEKKELLMSKYDLPEHHILYSRDTSFAEGIMRLTNGQGVDVILNSLSGEKLVASWECIAQVRSVEYPISPRHY